MTQNARVSAAIRRARSQGFPHPDLGSHYMVVDDPKIWRLAQLLVEKYGDEALAVVTERALGRMTVQEYSWAIAWTRVAEAVHTLCPNAKPERSVWHTQVPLKELMDDPLMKVLVQDDEDRRREVHDTLRDAKRKRDRESN